MAAITLEQLRTFGAEVAGADLSSAAGDREIQHWINGAIQRVWSEHDWAWAQSDGRIYMELAETGSAMDLTAASRTITLTGEVFKQKYVDDRWHLHVNGEGNQTFEIVSIESPTSATLKEGHQWAAATSTSTSYTWAKHIYPLPDDAVQVDRVEVMQSRLLLQGLSSRAFDSARQQTPTQRGNVPIYFTIRKGNIEVWPAPDATTHRTLNLSYRRGPTVYLSDAAGDTEVDWPKKWNDLLFKAMMLEASITQGENAVVKYQVALNEYETRLAIYKGEDSGIQDLSGPMTLGGHRGMDYSRITSYPSTIPEQS